MTHDIAMKESPQLLPHHRLGSTNSLQGEDAAEAINSLIPSSCQSFLFTIANYAFALPVAAVERVFRWKTPLSYTVQRHPAIQLDHCPATVLNLYPLIAQTVLEHSSTSDAATMRVSATDILMLIRLVGQQAFALMCDRPPILVDLPLISVHPVPAIYQSTLGLISHQMIVFTRSQQDDASAAAQSVSENNQLLKHLLPQHQTRVFLLDLKSAQYYGVGAQH